MKTTATGAFPKWAHDKKDFNWSQWLKKAKRKTRATTSESHASVRGYRMRRARVTLAKIERGELHPSAVAGLERDYKHEFKILRKEKR